MRPILLGLTGACLLSLAALGSTARANPGWLDTMPPDQVKLDPGRRNPVFYVGEPVRFRLSGGAPDRFEVRDYWGRVVQRGPAGRVLQLPPQKPGWYKLYVFGNPAAGNAAVVAYRRQFGDAVGGTTFVVFRRAEDFPELTKDAAYGSALPEDEPMRGVTGMGPQRLFVADAAKPAEEIKRLEADVALDKKWYLGHDPARGRALIIAFPNGTKGKLDGVRAIVARFKNDVTYWESRNEPNFVGGGADFATNELKEFYQTVKAVDPALKVLGPGTVTIGPQLQPWIEDFLRAGGGKYIDAFSFHAYNATNGDLWLARKSLDTLQDLLAKYHLDGIEKWQTEQGFFACVYGAYQPRLQGRWTMLQMMAFEQYGIPKEHNVYWYDRSHGFWDVPTWWENDDGGLNPAAALMRVWSEELYGKRFARRFDLGPAGNQLYLGSLFEGHGKAVAVFQSAGSPDGRITLRVKGGGRLHVVSAFGVEADLDARDGRAEVRVPELPVYLELAAGQSVEVVPQDFGADLARAAGVTARASGSGRHPLDPHIPNPISKLTNGELENWYWLQKPEAQPWMDDTPAFPAWVEVDFPRPTRIARVIVYGGVPWQLTGTPLDYELQYDDRGRWVTIEHVEEPANTFKVLTPVTRTKVDSFFSERWVFEHHFTPLVTEKIRLLVHDATYGGGATQDVADAGGQTGPHHINLREIEVYGQ